MKLDVPFECEVAVNALEKNYTGKIILKPSGRKAKMFHFLVLNPYAGSLAEFGLYHDERRKKPFAEGLGKETIVVNKNTSKPVTVFDFSEYKDPKVIGLIFVAVNIISAAIYKSEQKVKPVMRLAAKPPQCRFEDVWGENFSGEAEAVALAFIDSFERTE